MKKHLISIPFPRKEFTIKNVGIKRFWVGIAFGIICTVVFYLYLNAARDLIPILRAMFRYYDSDLLIYVSLWSNIFHNMLIAVFSAILGQHISIAIWISGEKKSQEPRKRNYINLSMYNLWFVVAGTCCYLISMFPPYFFYYAKLLKLYLFLPVDYIPPVIPGVNVVLHQDHILYWVLLTLFLFFHQCMILSRIYRGHKWLLLLSLSIVILVLALSTINIIPYQ